MLRWNLLHVEKLINVTEHKDILNYEIKLLWFSSLVLYAFYFILCYLNRRKSE